MNIAVAGFGRLGRPLANAILAAGNDVTVVTHHLRSKGPIITPGMSLACRGDYSTVGECDLVVLAVPSAVFTSGLDWTEELRPGTGIASVMAGVSLEQIRRTFPGHPATRFMCSAAIMHGESLRYIDADGESYVNDAIRRVLPSAQWLTFGSVEFDRMTTLLVTAPLICALLDEVSHKFYVVSEREQRFLAETILEAKRLIDCFESDSARAFDSAATPNGITRKLKQELFRS